MKTRFIIYLFLLPPVHGIAQPNTLAALTSQLATAQHDSARYIVYHKLSDFYIEKKIDSALFFMEQCLLLARKNNKRMNVAASLNGKGLLLRHKGQYSESLASYLEAFDIASDPESEKDFWTLPAWIFAADKNPRTSRLVLIGNLHMQMANLFIRTGNNELCIYHFAEAERIGRNTQSHYFLYYLYATMGIAYKNMNKLDSAMLIVQKGLSLSRQFGFKENVSRFLAYMGEIHFARSEIDTARKYYQLAMPLAIEERNFVSLVMIYFGLTKTYLAQQEKDSSLYYGRKTIEALNNVGSIAGTIWNPANAYENLLRIYTLRNERDSAKKYMELTLRAKDSLNTHSVKSSAQAQDLFLSEQIRVKELEKAQIRFRAGVRTWLLVAGIGLLLLLAVIFYRSNRQKQKAKERIEKAYDELRSTQAQLIQREKMASLGELTAGIAHEIQNPLNFVNNFSEVSNELIDEMKNELSKGNQGDVKAIVDDIKQNLEKINHHGKRAGAIVKGMLEHSRTNPGKKEPTDINALAEEYLGLAYHGMRAKDKIFHVTTKTNFDPGVGKINVVAQDIGRVILNLVNNAFYAVNEKEKQALSGYEPTVIVITKIVKPPLGGLGVEIIVKDNGNGITEKVLDKIFQPFFTTKPTGQGTGLGLSLAYDIVTKGHGGRLDVRTTVNEGTEFIVGLPY